MSVAAAALGALPASPGVYLFTNTQGEILYIGKARSLRDRVRTYFRRGSLLTPRIQSMIEQVADLDVLVTQSELEALLLENNLIKQHRPRYNILLMDDKHYPYIRLPIHDDFPRLEVVRRVARDGACYFGPYVPAHALRETLRVIRRAFPLATCELKIDGTAERPCIEYEIKRCMAPCTGFQTKADYHKIVAQVRLFLEGKDTELVALLRAQMEAEAEQLHFEEAARLRDRMWKVHKVLERQRITTTDLMDQDVVALAREGSWADLQLLFVRGGMLVGRKDLFWQEDAGTAEAEIYRSFLQQFYGTEVLIPSTILLATRLPDGERMVLGQWLAARRGGPVHLLSPSRGKDSPLLDMALENARVALAEHLRRKTGVKDAVVELAHLLGLSVPPRRIEAFDVSNTFGAQAVGSCVVWEDGALKKSAYRRYRIRTVAGADDCAMLREILTRHYTASGSPPDAARPRPDLIVVDGGRGQLTSALAVLDSLGLDDLEVIGLAKAKDEKEERVFLPREPEPIILPPSSPATHLLMRVRDEAHRFAVTYHRTLRGREAVASPLDEIPGVGEGIKRRLLRHFGSLVRIRQTSREDLEAVPGLPRKLARTIHAALHSPA